MDVEQLVRENIAKTFHMSLGTCRDNKPWVCEVHFAYDEDLNLYWRSLTSRRHSQDIAINSQVAGNIVRQFGLDEAPLGVYFEGRAKLLDSGEEQNKAFECITSRLQKDPSILDEAKDPQGHQFYKITVDTWYIFGVFDHKGQKLELKWDGNRS